MTVTVTAEAVAAIGRHADGLLQVAREALTNVRKHAQARSCSLRLERAADEVVLVVQDDGRGFDRRASAGKPAPDPGSAGEGAGQGLGNLARRAERWGGRLELEPRPGSGTTLRVTVPVE
jgi:signal transduction histidine kinase